MSIFSKTSTEYARGFKSKGDALWFAWLEARKIEEALEMSEKRLDRMLEEKAYFMGRVAHQRGLDDGVKDKEQIIKIMQDLQKECEERLDK